VIQPNHITGIVGAIFVVLAITGLMFVEETSVSGQNKEEMKSFHVTFPLTVGSVLASGSTNTNDQSTVPMSIVDPNMTTAYIMVTWTDHKPSYAKRSIVTVEVKDPAGTSIGDFSNSNGAAGISIPLGEFNKRPEAVDIKARSLEDAQTKVLAAYPTTTNGTGEWTLTISVAKDGYRGVLQTWSVDWSVNFGYNTYTASVSPAPESSSSGTAAMDASKVAGALQ
jgi:hypothetical protein